MVSPRASLAFDATQSLTLFANAGAGFHSNDARDVASYTLGMAMLQLTVDKLLNTRWNVAQFATTCILQGESLGITELNFTPGAPCTIQLGARVRYQ